MIRCQHRHVVLASGALLLAVAAPRAHARQLTAIDGPPAPVAPAVITRTSSGQATVRAIKLAAPLTLDGVLDEPVYKNEAPFGGLIQVAPDAGAPATERSDLWISYDDRNIYLSGGAES